MWWFLLIIIILALALWSYPYIVYEQRQRCGGCDDSPCAVSIALAIFSFITVPSLWLWRHAIEPVYVSIKDKQESRVKEYQDRKEKED